MSLAMCIIAGSMMAAAPAEALPPDWPPPEATVRLAYDFGRCDTNVLRVPRDVSVQVDIVVQNQFDPDAKMTIPQFLWQRQLPMTVTPQTTSLQFIANRPGSYGFSITPSAITGSTGAGCQGTIVVE
ncbi:hypothetical protein Ntsu_49070 [Nocardia sp. IFM 10818]